MTRIFELEVILSVTTGTLLCKLDRIYDILQYMTGEPVFTHQLPLVADICKHALWAQYPNLRNLSAVDVDRDNWLEYVHLERYLLGNYFLVLPLEHWTPRNPFVDASRMVGNDKVVIVELPA